MIISKNLSVEVELDEDNDLEFVLQTNRGEFYFYLNEEELKFLKNHIEKIIK